MGFFLYDVPRNTTNIACLKTFGIRVISYLMAF
jgi:hypothetical protein